MIGEDYILDDLNWDGTPKNHKEAIDRLAALLALLTGKPIPKLED